MKTFIATSICFILLIQGCDKKSSETAESASLHLADQRYWPGPEENLALTIAGKFNTLEEMTSAFRLDNTIGAFEHRTWIFADILVSMNCNANGYVTSWVVSGPKPLISDYIQRLENLYKHDKVFYDFCYSEIEVTAGCRM